MEIPIGTIIAFGGGFTDEIKKHFLLCDGSILKKKDFKELSDAIGTAWGTAKNDLEFKIPDLRGLFLRGVNGDRTDAFCDPDADKRTGRNTVGSIQTDELRTHHHDFPGDSELVTIGHNSYTPGHADAATNGAKQTKDFGGSETRPKNAYVYYLIKAKN
jgi:microcystin-dependent protein